MGRDGRSEGGGRDGRSEGGGRDGRSDGWVGMGGVRGGGKGWRSEDMLCSLPESLLA